MDAPECLGAFEMKRSTFQDDECVFGLTCKPTKCMLLNTTSLHLCDQFIWISVYDFMFFFFLSDKSFLRHTQSFSVTVEILINSLNGIYRIIGRMSEHEKLSKINIYDVL